LTFVSPGPHERVSQLAAAAGVGGRVRIVDADSADMASELQAASVLVNPRVHCPGYPLKLLNYMAARRPIVSFRSSGKNLRHGIDALLVPDGDVEGFADAIGALLADPAQCDRLGEAARKQVFAHYSWAAITGRVSKAYDQALLAPGGGAEHVAL
jgi:glycosyltransferase involved in cell wall biosynthesis